jgi:hypothetical protein
LLAKTINHPNALLIHTLSKPDQTKMWNLIKTIMMLKFQLIIYATDELYPVVMFEMKLPEGMVHAWVGQKVMPLTSS